MSSLRSSDAVLFCHHGTIADPRDLPAFLANIRRGRPAPPELVAEVGRRYALIGGSPLTVHSNAQASALEARLGVPVRVAGRLWHPYPEHVLRELAATGARRVLSLPLAPQSVDVYHDAVREAAARLTDLELVTAPAWGSEPLVIDALVETVDEGLANAARSWAAPIDPQRTPIVLSAHSLPMRVIASGDRYEVDFRAMAALVAERLTARGHSVEVAFQSQGASSEAWLGPDLRATFEQLLKRGFRTVLVAPIGFVAEHVETLYDLDIECVAIAREAGMQRYARAPTLGTRPRFIDALEQVARRSFAGATTCGRAR